MNKMQFQSAAGDHEPTLRNRTQKNPMHSICRTMIQQPSLLRLNPPGPKFGQEPPIVAKGDMNKPLLCTSTSITIKKY
ncbi:hypothetical protein [Pasteuria penetrans]|uniref:hypothetical protein n=1 Tax=Pasteuria penetrans TaxID=86005 RepID=UPI0011EC4243|nr:hypothetical protein [Pasteuria penetrans]